MIPAICCIVNIKEYSEYCNYLMFLYVLCRRCKIRKPKITVHIHTCCIYKIILPLTKPTESMNLTLL